MRSLHAGGLKSLLKLADLPNTLGFKFIGVNRGWQEVDCVIAYSEEKGFYVEGEDFAYLQGWKYSRGEAAKLLGFSEELAAKLLGFSEDYEPDDVEQKLWDVYEISMDSFHRLICDLAPMCEVGQSPITGEKFRGFSDVASQSWIARVDA